MACMADFPGGTWLVELTPLTQPGLVVQTVAHVLGVREHPERPLIDLVAEHLKSSEALVVLDNCEHLLDEVARLVQQLLQSCARLSILATSRERLGITGELLRTVSGLAVPGPDAEEASEVGDADACRLLVERAVSVHPGFRLDENTAAAVARICRRLDGLPLAIEASGGSREAPWKSTRSRSASTIVFVCSTRARGRPCPVTGRYDRVVDWSYALLSAAERRLFDRAAVFIGGFTLEAAEAVCGAPDEDADTVPMLISRLVNKSLIVSEHTAAGGGRSAC